MTIVTLLTILVNLYLIFLSIVSAISTSDFHWFDTTTSTASPWLTTTTASTPWPIATSRSPWLTTTTTSTPWPITTSRSPWLTTTTATTTWPTTTTNTTPWPTTTRRTSWPTTTARTTWPASSPSTSSFNKVNILLARNVQLRATSSPSDYSTTITCDDPSILPYIRKDVSQDSTLTISATSDCDVNIRAYNYQAIHIDTVSRLIMTDYSYRGYQLRFVSMGNSQIDIINVDYDFAEFLFLGNSTVKLGGNIGALTVVTRGKGSVDATHVATPHVNATLSGIGSLQVKSTVNMNLIVEGTGNLTWCSPKVQMDVTPDVYGKTSILYQC
ncbi:unnamed protein product [Rotaria sp. Silwood1]|nr:unnamed protein product [Rotaria sp. Silwood1]